MNRLNAICGCLLTCVLFLVIRPASAQGQTSPSSSKTAVQLIAQALSHDGQHDFDFEFGSWNIHLKRLLNRLTPGGKWVEFDGTTITRKVWGGKAQLEQFETSGAAGQIEGMTLRLYNPQSHQWSIYWATSKDGVVGIPTIGEFSNAQGEFYDQEPINGRMILVRFIWSGMTPAAAHFEQSFSPDGGKTWEVNWITDQQRVKADADPTFLNAPAMPAWKPGAAQDHQHDFDFEFGRWKTHLRRLVHPLSGSKEWIDLDGTSVVDKIWNGRANLGELEVAGGSTQIDGLSLRLYNPESHQWNIYWSNSKDATLGTAMIGNFSNGRGEFYNQETFEGRAVYVRFIFSDITPNSFRLEQAFSADGGKTWEPNWIASFTREKS